MASDYYEGDPFDTPSPPHFRLSEYLPSALIAIEKVVRAILPIQGVQSGNLLSCATQLILQLSNAMNVLSVTVPSEKWNPSSWLTYQTLALRRLPSDPETYRAIDLSIDALERFHRTQAAPSLLSNPRRIAKNLVYAVRTIVYGLASLITGVPDLPIPARLPKPFNC